MNSRGLSVETVIDQMTPGTLHQLLGKNLIDTLIKLSNSQQSDDELRQVAKTLYAENNPATIRDAATRGLLIKALPLQKAKELGERLGVSLDGNIFANLEKIKFGERREQDEALFSFFGIVANEPAPSLQRPNTIEAAPKYGLFEYQRVVVLRTLRKLNEPPRKVLLHMPTGSGKTRTTMHVIGRHLQQHEKTLVCWLANSGELLEQAADEIKRSWDTLGDRPIKIYRFWGESNLDLSSVRDGVLVAGFAKMHASYLRNQNLLIALGDRSSLTIVDEAHQAIAPTYRSVIEALYTKRPENALLGLTATPGRSWNDVPADRELSKFFGSEKVTIAVEGYPDPVSFLMDKGYLAKPRFRTIRFSSEISLAPEEEAILRDGGDPPERAINALSTSPDRNYLIINEIEDLLTRHKRIIVFAASVKHAHLLAGILVWLNHDAKTITAETPNARRDFFIRRFRSNNPAPMILCNYGVLTTGFDAPKTSSVVIARPTQSLVLYSQMVGRAIRGPRAGGNSKAEIVTVVDTSLPGFGSVAEAFSNWEDVWDEHE